MNARKEERSTDNGQQATINKFFFFSCLPDFLSLQRWKTGKTRGDE